MAIKNITTEQKAYFGSFVDCDGSLMAQIVERKDYTLKYQLRVSVSFTQKNRRSYILKQIQSETGLGTFRDRGDRCSDLTIVGAENVSSFLGAIKPFLRMKVKQANLLLRIIEKLPRVQYSPERFLELCELSDQVAALNDSKTRKHTSETVKKKYLDLGMIEN